MMIPLYLFHEESIKEEEVYKGGGGGHLPHFTDFGSLLALVKERLMDEVSSIYFWRRCWGGSSGDATERKVGII